MSVVDTTRQGPTFVDFVVDETTSVHSAPAALRHRAPQKFEDAGRHVGRVTRVVAALRQAMATSPGVVLENRAIYEEYRVSEARQAIRDAQ